MSTRHVLGVVCLSLQAMACFTTETEVITAADSVRLCGRHFSIKDTVKTRVFGWDEKVKGYVDVDRDAVVRFARLKADAYLCQVQVLKDPEPDEEQPATRPSKAYSLALARVVPPRLSLQIVDCNERGNDREWLARGYGVEIEDRGLYSGPRLTGDRAGIIGFLTAALQCDFTPMDAGTVDTGIVPESLRPGGPELAAQGVSHDRGRFLAFFDSQCRAGRQESCYRMGQIYLKGDGVAKDVARAAQVFDRLCTAGHAPGCLELGLLHDRGEGVARDGVRARELWRKACAGGEMYACDVLKSAP